MERLYNIREGINSDEDRLPDRLLRESIFRDIQGGVPLDKMIPQYYKIRGWDAEGAPTEATLNRLSVKH